jgi:hypothetical protein
VGTTWRAGASAAAVAFSPSLFDFALIVFDADAAISLECWHAAGVYA